MKSLPEARSVGQGRCGNGVPERWRLLLPRFWPEAAWESCQNGCCSGVQSRVKGVLMSAGRPRLGGILIKQGVITQQELEAAVLYQIRAESAAGRTLLADAAAAEGGMRAARLPRLGEALILLGICSDVEVACALAEQMEVPFVDLRATPPMQEALKLVPRALALEYGAVPVRLVEDKLLVAMSEPGTARVVEVLQEAAGTPVVLACAPETQVRDQLQEYWEQEQAATNTGLVERDAAPKETSTAVEMVTRFIADAARSGATDLYFEPTEDTVSVQSCIDGEMHRMATLRRGLLHGLMAQVKMMCGMDLAEKPRPQDGRCRVRVDGKSVELQASTRPGPLGECAVLRFVG